MRIAYLHGLNSPAGQDKLKELSKYGDFYAPIIDYENNISSIFNKILREVTNFNPDVIIGSSMGGFMSYHIGNKLNKPMVIFNPPLYSRTLDIKFESNTHNSKEIIILQGKDDEVVSPELTVDWLKNNHQGRYQIERYNGAHRVPLKMFKYALTKANLYEYTSYDDYENFIEIYQENEKL